MRVNVYAEEMTDRIEIIATEIDGQQFTGLRFYLELPATVGGKQYRGPFLHRPGDDDSGAVTFWGKRDLRGVLRRALGVLDTHYDAPSAVVETAPSPIAGLHVGRTLQDGELCDLILLPGEFKGTWTKAQQWAAEQGGALPSRIDLLVLFQRAKGEFKGEWYWSCEQFEGDEAYAWYQDFSTGYQDIIRKDAQLRARAVRRVAIR